ncbi:MAG TPA: hypothetical protein DDY29_02910 [Rhodobacteraceae bacterium]|nr:hypothetical protein [Paracoccaceae bacterium]
MGLRTNMRTILAILLFAVLGPVPAAADIRADVAALFEAPALARDLGTIKLDIDRMVDPATDSAAALARIDSMAATISDMTPEGATAWERLAVLQRYVYQPGPWNGGNAFAYDHDDPLGEILESKLLAGYLSDRRGNCVTMPFLYVILGERLGLDMAPAMAPLHILVKFTDDSGAVHNLETTSGAGRARDQHYRELLPITDAAVENGIFLTPLDRRETVAVMAALVVEHLMARGRYHDAIAVSDTLLDQYPGFVYVMVKRGTAAYHLLRTEFHAHYPTIADVPEDKRGYLDWLLRINAESFDRAEALGWRPVEE